MTSDERYWTTWILVTRLLGIGALVVAFVTMQWGWLLAVPVVGVCQVYFGWKQMKARENGDE